MGTSVQTLPDTDFYRAFADRVRKTVAEHTRTADQAPATEPLLPACHVCGDTTGPWYPDPSGARWPSGAQKLVCGQHRGEAAEPTAPPAGKTWTITTEHGASITGYLPPWDPQDPSEENIPANYLELRLSDLAHVRHFDGQIIEVDVSQGGGKGRYVGPCGILEGGIWLQPYSDDPAERVPMVRIEALEGSDDWLTPLDPDGVADLAAKLRAQADRLDNEVRPMLIAAREDWARNGGAR
ncbi:DUF6907 domain-containing protein [Actinacidiphila sp. ITFR-21]|uniref:DUF6907 domain-containing protein n=1 Tax=Actinacidiphila sp. ITFR-21 TaxID=3075199 RepID=UPI002889D25F|nr:hypothetical protein [Streptomyces sp. ITFR-21]WNI15236.1 hypothetical protein RLT57_06585 [Streptomyces sp. ITFR-21]